MKQIVLFKDQPKAYGGDLMKSRAGRLGPRPLVTKSTMHLVLRASQAKGEFSFRSRINDVKIRAIIKKFSTRYGIRILSFANVGNHLHFHLKLGNRFTYTRFIRAITGAIALTVMGKSKWEGKFWDTRPFTRALRSYGEYLNLTRYIQINDWEGSGINRKATEFVVQKAKEVIAEMNALVKARFHTVH